MPDLLVVKRVARATRRLVARLRQPVRGRGQHRTAPPTSRSLAVARRPTGAIRAHETWGQVPETAETRASPGPRVWGPGSSDCSRPKVESSHSDMTTEPAPLAEGATGAVGRTVRSCRRRSGFRGRSGRPSRPHRGTRRRRARAVRAAGHVVQAGGVRPRVRAGYPPRLPRHRVHAGDDRRGRAGPAVDLPTGRTLVRRPVVHRDPGAGSATADTSAVALPRALGGRGLPAGFALSVEQPLPAPLHALSVQPAGGARPAQAGAADRDHGVIAGGGLDAVAGVTRRRGDRDAGVVVRRALRASRSRRSCC